MEKQRRHLEKDPSAVLVRWGGAIVAALCLNLAAPSFALPGLMDHWHFFCAPRGTNDKQIAKAKQRADKLSNAVNSGVAILQYACLLSAMQHEQHAKQVQSGQGNAPPPDKRRTLGMVKAAVSHLAQAVKQRPSDTRARYYYGYALALLGDDWAVNRLDEVARLGDKARYAPEATLAIAEYYFEKKGAADALDQYKLALRTKKPIIRSYARYKLAWIDFARGTLNRQRAVQKQAIVKLAELFKELSESKGISRALSAVIKRDILDLTVNLGDPGEAQQILKSVGATDVYATFLERAAYAKAAESDAPGAYKLFTLALKERPHAPENLRISIDMAALAAQVANVPLLVNNLKYITRVYLHESSTWRKRRKAPELRQADKQIEEILSQYAVGIDQQGRAENKPAYMQAASELYGLYFKSFPKSPKAYELRFYHGQLLYLLKRYQDAAETLTAMIKEKPRGAHTKDALELLVTAAQYVVDNDKRVYRLPKPGTARKPIKIPDTKKLYADSLDLFVKHLPRNENAPVMRYTAASVYYDFGHYDEGVKRYLTYINGSPRDDFAKTAAARVLEYYKRQKSDLDYKKMRNRIAAIPTLRGAPELAAYFAAPAKPAKEVAKPAKAPPAKGVAADKPESTLVGTDSVEQSETDAAISASTPKDEPVAPPQAQPVSTLPAAP